MPFSFAILACLVGPFVDPPTPIPAGKVERSKPVSFVNEVSEILDAKCVGCHGLTLAESKLNMESVAGMLKGGKKGPALVPGKAESSLLFQMAAHRVDPVMPPREKKDLPSLTPAELGLLKLWIDSGARDDSETATPPPPIDIGVLPPGVHPINAVDITADGRRVAAGRANLVQVIDVDSGLQLAGLGGHKDLIQSVRFSPDGRRLAAGGYQVVTVWDVPKLSLDRTFAGIPEPITTFVATRDGKTLVSGGTEKALRIWDASNGKPARTIAVPCKTECLSLSPDDTLVAAGGSDGVVRIFGLADAKERHALAGHVGPVSAVVFHPSGKSLFSAGFDGTFRAWNLAIKPGESPQGRTIASFDKRPIVALALVPDGDSVVLSAGGDALARRVAVSNGKVIQTYNAPAVSARSIAIDSKREKVVIGCSDGAIRGYHLGTGGIVETLRRESPEPAQSVGPTISPDGDQVVTSNDTGGIEVREMKTGRVVMAMAHPPASGNGSRPAIVAARFVGPGKVVTSATDKSMRAWSFSGDWGVPRTLGPHTSRVLAIDFSPDGKRIATGGGEPSRSGEVKLWDAATGKLIRSLDNLHSDTVFALRFSPDGTKLATASADKFLKVIDVESGKELKSFEGHTHHVQAVDWKSDGKRLITGGADNVLKVWDYETGEQVRTLTQATKQVTGLDWVPDKPMVVAASGDMTVRAWNPENGQVIRSFSGPTDYVLAVAASSDGGRVAAGAADGTLWIWNGANGQVILPIPRP